MQVYHAFEQEYYTTTQDTLHNSQHNLDDIVLSERISRTTITLCVNAKVLTRPIQLADLDFYAWKYIDLEIQQYLRNQTHVSLPCPFNLSKTPHFT